jgi:hypothetical protein
MSEPELPKTETPKELPAASPGNPKRTFLDMLRDVFLERYPEAKPVHAYLGERMPGMRLKRWVFYSGLALFLSLSIGAIVHYADKSISDSKILETNDFFTRSNSFLFGVIQAQKDQILRIQNQFQDYKRGSESQINGLKTDLGKVTGEKDSSQIRVAQLESMPQTAMLVWSNASTLSKSDFDTHNFGLIINGLYITNYIYGQSYVIPLKTNREVAIIIPPLNLGEKTIEKLTIEFEANFDKINIVSGIADGWWKFRFGTFSLFGKNAFLMQEVSQDTVNSLTGFSATPFTVSTNLQPFPAIINIYAPGIKGVQTFVVNFTFP